MNIVDISTTPGYEVSAVSAAKDTVYDALYEAGLDPDEFDLINFSDRAVGALISEGWRPTE